MRPIRLLCSGAGGYEKGGGGLLLVLPTIALDMQSGQGPFRAEAVNGLQHASPYVLQEIVPIEDQGDQDALAGGQNTERAGVLSNPSHLLSDLHWRSPK